MAARGGGTRIGGIVIDVLGNTAGLQQELKNADRAVAQFAKKFSSEWKSATAGLGKGVDSILNMKTALVGLVGAAGLGSLVKNTLGLADSIGEASDALGLSTQAYQELSFAASQAGIDQEKFTASFSKFVQLGESASQGDKSAGAVFTRLGISAKEAGDDVESLFNLVVQQLDKIPTQNEKLKILGDLFGAKVAAKWAATLATGADGLREMRDQAQQMGLVLDDASVRGLGRLSDQLDAVTTKFQIAFATGLVEGLTSKTGDMTDILKDPDVVSSLQQWADLFEQIGAAAGVAAQAAKDLLPVLQEVKNHPFSVGLGMAGASKFGIPGAVVGGAAGFILDETTIKQNQDSPLRPSGVPPLLAMHPVDGVPGLLARPAPLPPPSNGHPLGSNPNAAAEQAAKTAATRQAQIDQFIASLNAEVAGLQIEAAAVSQSVAAQQEAAVQKELLNTLTDKSIELGTKEAVAIEAGIRTKAAATNQKGAAELLANMDAEVQSTQEHVDSLSELTAARVQDNAVSQAMAAAAASGIILSGEEIAKIDEKAAALGRLAVIEEDVAKARQGFEQAGQIIAGAFEAAIFNAESLHDALGKLVEDLARLALQQLVEKPLVDALGTLGGELAKSFSAPAAAASFDAPTAAQFDAPAASRAVADQQVPRAPEVNVMIATPEGHSASVKKKQNASGGIDMEVLVEQITAIQTQHTLRGRGFSGMFKAMGVSRSGMTG